MRVLYFDLDGTVLVRDTSEPKAALANGRLEDAIRQAGFDRLVCVGNFVEVIHVVREARPDFDGLGAIFGICHGTLRDEKWFRGMTVLAVDPKNRGVEIDLDEDWWYVDDLAWEYLLLARRQSLLGGATAERILKARPMADGSDVIAWLGAIPRRTWECDART